VGEAFCEGGIYFSSSLMVFSRMFAAHVLATSIFALGARSGEFEKAGSKAPRLLKRDLPLPRQDGPEKYA